MPKESAYDKRPVARHATEASADLKLGTEVSDGAGLGLGFLGFPPSSRKKDHLQYECPDLIVKTEKDRYEGSPKRHPHTMIKERRGAVQLLRRRRRWQGRRRRPIGSTKGR